MGVSLEGSFLEVTFKKEFIEIPTIINLNLIHFIEMLLLFVVSLGIIPFLKLKSIKTIFDTHQVICSFIRLKFKFAKLYPSLNIN